MPSQKVLEQKKAIVEELAEKLKRSCAGVLVDYKGINVEDDTKLRKELRASNVDYSVVKNTLLLRALQNSGIEGLESVLEGTTALAVSEDDYVAAARILCQFAQANKFFDIKAGFVEGKKISAAEVDELAKLPSREVLIAKVLYGLNAPITGLVTVLSGTIKSLAVVLDAIAKKKSA